MDDKERITVESTLDSDQIRVTSLGGLYDEADEDLEESIDDGLHDEDLADDPEDYFEPDDIDDGYYDGIQVGDDGYRSVEYDDDDDEPGPTVIDRRLARLEAAAAALAEAEIERERRRVKRKVTAGTTGAGTVGFVPLLLQLAGALNLDAEIVAALSTGAASLGALLAGYFTPEREDPLPRRVGHDIAKLAPKAATPARRKKVRKQGGRMKRRRARAGAR